MLYRKREVLSCSKRFDYDQLKKAMAATIALQ